VSAQFLETMEQKKTKQNKIKQTNRRKHNNPGYPWTHEQPHTPPCLHFEDGGSPVSGRDNDDDNDDDYDDDDDDNDNDNANRNSNNNNNNNNIGLCDDN